MTVAIKQAKPSFQFRVHFEDFGTGTGLAHLTTQVLRVGRPGVVVRDILGLTEVQSRTISIDLRDDITDRTRAEVVTQVSRQIKDDAHFALVIEVLDTADKVLEQWFLADCQIVRCKFDELKLADGAGLTIKLTVSAKRIATTVLGEMLNLFD